MNEMNETWVLYLLGKFWLDEYKLSVRLFNSQDLSIHPRCSQPGLRGAFVLELYELG